MYGGSNLRFSTPLKVAGGCDSSHQPVKPKQRISGSVTLGMGRLPLRGPQGSMTTGWDKKDKCQL